MDESPLPTPVVGELPRLIDYPATQKDEDVHGSKETGDKWGHLSYQHIVQNHQRSVEQHLRPFVTYVRDSGSSRVLGEFTLVRRIGSGQYGDVFMARSSTGDYVAVKCIPKRPRNSHQYSMNQVLRQIRRNKFLGRTLMTSDEAIVEMNMHRIRWEVFVTSRFQHANILGINSCIDSPLSQQIWIVSPLASLGELQWKRSYKSESLGQWNQVLRHKTDANEFAEFVLRSLASGLQYLADQGCVHRDIKPSNILVNERYSRVMLSDFGSSLLIPEKLPFYDTKLPSAYREEINKIAGTPAFTAPELCNFEKDDQVTNGFQLDIWSLGITIYCLLENKLPFRGDNEFDTFHKIAANNISPTGHWIHDLVVSELLNKEPGERITVQALMKLLNQPKKEKGMKRFVSKLRRLSFKGTNKTKPNEEKLSTPFTASPEERFVDQKSNLSFSGSSSNDEPVRVIDFTDTERLSCRLESTGSLVEVSGSLDDSPEDCKNKNLDAPLEFPSGMDARSKHSSPVKVDTAIKIQETPEQLQYTVTEDHQLPDSQRNTKLMPSSGTLDFSKYLESASQKDLSACNIRVSAQTSNTMDDIRRYMNYADGI
ncbi:LADA_0G09098g1_1 [Lachancea dasiensis]|uniref:LADA_0G09098g1_1 n=1 Tax=Lachancea dasiensis TaxID=1072105 RepID=A0A1G4JUE0_9SACH|nr:LADA_0G09098g1_1 [Lachancea dasiensis]